jgi:hypothetical protein
MNKKYLQFTIGAANALVKTLVPANTDWFITMPTTSTLLFHSMGSAHAGSDVVTITFTTADATYASHYAVINALALANSAHSNPDVIIVPALPLVGATQQLITSVAIA